jgi:ADP-ribosyl-[dinitrogen reductase] hydrolase
MLGACVGDAAGGPLEFMGRTPTMKQVKQALQFKGGGCMSLDPGQITDDGELTLSLYKALTEPGATSELPIPAILKQYDAWYRSQPIDCGGTCERAFKLIRDSTSITDYLQSVSSINSESEANGALMRATAIPRWAYCNRNLTAEAIAELGRQEACLSHPSRVCQECNMIYVYACTLLLRRVTDVWASCVEYAKQIGVCDTVMQWLADDSGDISALVATKNIGHIRWAFTLAMYFLRFPANSFEEALQITLLKGGDTDTNAAIVGGLVGCYLPIPDKLTRPVLQCKPDGTTSDMNRPQWLWPATYFMN